MSWAKWKEPEFHHWYLPSNPFTPQGGRTLKSSGAWKGRRGDVRKHLLGGGSHQTKAPLSNASNSGSSPFLQPCQAHSKPFLHSLVFILLHNGWLLFPGTSTRHCSQIIQLYRTSVWLCAKWPTVALHSSNYITRKGRCYTHYWPHCHSLFVCLD